MRNKLLAVLLALCMVMALLPAAAFADENDNGGDEDPTECPDCGCEYYNSAGNSNACCFPATKDADDNVISPATCNCSASKSCGHTSCTVCRAPGVPPAPKSCYCGCSLTDGCGRCSVTWDATAGRYDYHCGCNGGDGNCGCGDDCSFTKCVCGCGIGSCSSCSYDDVNKKPVCGCGGSPDLCPCGKETLEDEGHCTCEDPTCIAPSHRGRPLGMIGNKPYGAVCITVPEDGGLLCNYCKAYAEGKLGGNDQDDGKQDEGKKDDGQKPSTPAADPSAPRKAEDFSDVDAGMWYNDDLTTLLEKGWFVGQAGGKFAPQSATTGAEVVVILSRVAGEDLVTTGSGWNVAATEWAARQGITDGIEITTSGTLARQDLILMLWRAANKPASTHALDFTDIDGVSGDALTALRWAVEKGIVKGNGDGTVSPNGATKRCEMAALMVRYDQAVKG